MLERKNGDAFWRALHTKLKRLYSMYLVDFIYVNFKIILKIIMDTNGNILSVTRTNFLSSL